MNAATLRAVLLVDAVWSVGTGFLFLAGTWDGLWNLFDLPQGKPALFVQLGGAVLWGVAYLLWIAARTPTLMLPVARASAVMNGLATAVLLVWLVAGDPDAGMLGIALLIATAVISAAFTVLYLMAGVRSGGYGPEPPPPPAPS